MAMPHAPLRRKLQVPFYPFPSIGRYTLHTVLCARPPSRHCSFLQLRNREVPRYPRTSMCKKFTCCYWLPASPSRRRVADAGGVDGGMLHLHLHLHPISSIPYCDGFLRFLDLREGGSVAGTDAHLPSYVQLLQQAPPCLPKFVPITHSRSRPPCSTASRYVLDSSPT